MVTSIQLQTLKLSKKKKTEVLLVHFSGALEPGSAQSLGDYQLGTVTKGKKPGSHAIKPLPLVSATYSSAMNTVTLTPRGTVPAGTLQLTINATATLDSEGRPIEGKQGGNVVATFGKAGITLASVSRLALASRVSAEAVDAVLATGQLASIRTPWPGRP